MSSCINRDCKIEDLAYLETNGYKVLKLSDVKTWLSDKLVITKGNCRHLHADVMHAYAEGNPIEFKCANGSFIPINNPMFTETDEYRIEQEFEYQWMYKENGYFKITHCYYYDTPTSSEYQTDWKRMEESKRERKKGM